MNGRIHLKNEFELFHSLMSIFGTSQLLKRQFLLIWKLQNICTVASFNHLLYPLAMGKILSPFDSELLKNDSSTTCFYWYTHSSYDWLGLYFPSLARWVCWDSQKICPMNWIHLPSPFSFDLLYSIKLIGSLIWWKCLFFFRWLKNLVRLRSTSFLPQWYFGTIRNE